MKRLQDIADQVGVSRTTVSNVLHGNTKKVSKEMIRKISEILNQEGYVPDTSSRELTRKGSCIIGLVLGYNCVHGIPSLRDTFVAELLSGVEETAHRNGYYVMLINGHDQNTDRVAEIASRWNVDGLVVLGLDEQKYKELRRQLNKYMVLIDTYPEAEYHYVNVGTDDFGGGAMIAKYLLDNGYTQAGLHRGGIPCLDAGVQVVKWHLQPFGNAPCQIPAVAGSRKIKYHGCPLILCYSDVRLPGKLELVGARPLHLATQDCSVT